MRSNSTAPVLANQNLKDNLQKVLFGECKFVKFDGRNKRPGPEGSIKDNTSLKGLSSPKINITDYHDSGSYTT